MDEEKRIMTEEDIESIKKIKASAIDLIKDVEKLKTELDTSDENVLKALAHVEKMEEEWKELVDACNEDIENWNKAEVFDDEEEEFEPLNKFEELGMLCCLNYVQMDMRKISADEGLETIEAIIDSARSRLNPEEYNNWLGKYVRDALVHKSHRMLDRLGKMDAKAFDDPDVLRSLLSFAGLI